MLNTLLRVRTNDPALSLRGQLLQGALLLLGVGCALELVLLISAAQLDQGLFARIIAILIIGIISFALARFGRVQLGAGLMCVALLLIISSADNPDTLLGRPLAIAYFLPILLGGLVIGAWSVLVFGSLSVLILVGLSTVSSGEAGVWAVLSPLSIGLTSGLIWLIVWTLERATQQAQARAEAAAAAQASLEAREVALQQANQEMSEANQHMQTLLATIQDLELPLLPLLNGVLVVPLIGTMDTQRIERVSRTLLEAIHSTQTHTVILDLTGLTLVDSAVVRHLHQLGRAVQLLGAQVVVSGVSARIAQLLSDLNLDFGGVATTARLNDGVQLVLKTQNGRLEANGVNKRN